MGITMVQTPDHVEEIGVLLAVACAVYVLGNVVPLVLGVVISLDGCRRRVSSSTMQRSVLRGTCDCW